RHGGRGGGGGEGGGGRGGEGVHPSRQPLRRDLGPARAGRGPHGPGQTLKPRALSCSRPSSVILSGPHGGSHTQLIRKPGTMPSSAAAAWSSSTSVRGQAAVVRVRSMVAAPSSPRAPPST